MPHCVEYLWGKTRTVEHGDSRWHPLVCHCLDVAACADVLLAHEPPATSARLAATLGEPWAYARPWLLLLIAAHDLGKATPAFQRQWTEWLPRCPLPLPRPADFAVLHGVSGQVALTELLRKHAWPHDLAELAASAVTCHHGARPSETELDRHENGGDPVLGNRDWAEARRSLFDALAKVFRPGAPPNRETLDGPDFLLLAGLTSFADWIGSNEDWFPYVDPADCLDLSAWYEIRRTLAERALDALGWLPRTPLCVEHQEFADVFGFAPRPLQAALAQTLDELDGPAVLLVEAPMGEGKTEAAYYAHLELQRRFDHRGLYIALPTQATGNAMFARTLDFLKQRAHGRTLDLQLVHGATLLNDTFADLRLKGIADVESGGEVRAGEWFTHKKRALLSEYGVGTVDQALLGILPVRHQFVRLWGMANRVVVFDEIHAYDAYTGTLLEQLVRWLVALGSSVILLSATLPPNFRRRLAQAVDAPDDQRTAEYPRLTAMRSGWLRQHAFPADPARRRTVRIEGIGADLTALRAAVDGHLPNGAALVLVNTVQRAQDLYRLWPAGERLMRDGHCVGKRLADGSEVLLFHARCPAAMRRQREEEVLACFGPRGARSTRQILIATQVAEQSLDLDFDLLVTDLAPIDLVLQRAGRLWRHARTDVPVRPLAEPLLLVAGLADEMPPDFGRPLWWSAVYGEDVLLRSWALLKERAALTLPDDIDGCVSEVYEELNPVPEALRERLERAIAKAEGERMAERTQARQAHIGRPQDEWNDPNRFVLFDEDAPGLHRSLVAKTRLGKDAVTVIPLKADEPFDPAAVPDFASAKRLFGVAVSLSRQGVVHRLRDIKVPEGWQQSSLLRNAYPLRLDAHGRWTEDATVRLDEELGVLYETDDQRQDKEEKTRS